MVKPCLHEMASSVPQDRFPPPTVQPAGFLDVRLDSGEVSPDSRTGVLQTFDVHDRPPFPAALHRLERIVLVGFVFVGEDDPGGLPGAGRRFGFVVSGDGRTSCRPIAGSSRSASETNRRRNDSNVPTRPPPAAA